MIKILIVNKHFSSRKRHGKVHERRHFDCVLSDPPLGASLAASSVVRQVHEYYAEFCAVNEDFFSANCTDTLQLALPRPPTAARKLLLSRNRDAVLSVLLALKKKPSTIRYAVRVIMNGWNPAAGVLYPFSSEIISNATGSNHIQNTHRDTKL